MKRLGLAAALLFTAGVAGAQCPDGSPPPCRARPTAAVAPTRRADPPLDANTWIVLPFDNLARSPEVEWLRDASVNLLYLDLSKWQDVRVVDDERVADLLRATPEAQGAKALSLAAGLAVARRAGAGKLVMGDLIRIGARTTMTAKVFDVKGGQRIRTANQDAPVQDSLMPAFGRLARGILNVAPPSGANVGEIGTTNTAAYQDYLDGVRALNRFDLKHARAQLEAALRKDSTFALAHYKLAVLIGWTEPDDEAKNEHARAASRFGSTLPTRERTLIAGLLAFDNMEYGRACAAYSSLVQSDSTDVDALYGMGECLYHDNVIETVGGDSTRAYYRGSYNAAIRAFRRALAIDPSFHLAFQHILDAYTAEGRQGCRLKDPSATKVDAIPGSCAEVYNAAVRRDGDSLLMVPVSTRNQPLLLSQTTEARRTNAHYANIVDARRVAKEWVDAGPTEPRAMAILARIDLMLGNVEAADQEIAQVRTADLDDIEGGRLFLARIETWWKMDGHEADLVHAIDSLASLRLGAQATISTGYALAALGRPAMFDSILKEAARKGGAPPEYMPYLHHVLPLIIGYADDSIAAIERRMFDGTLTAPGPVGGVRSATSNVLVSQLYGLRMPRPSRPLIDSIFDPRLAPAIALAHGDTAALRRAAVALETSVTAAGDRTPDDGSALIATEAYLELHDSTAALRTIRQYLDHGIRPTAALTNYGGGYTVAAFVWPRCYVLRGDLEATAPGGSKAEARRAYRKFIALWTKADPQFQPMVERARKSLAALGSG